MSFISRWFSKSPSDLLAKGDRYMESDSYFDARTCYEDGVRLCSGETGGDLKVILSERIDTANRKLAELNIQEAEFAHARGDAVKAVDHLELVKSLTADRALREQADTLLLQFSQPDRDPDAPVAVSSSCSSCSGSSCGDSTESVPADNSLPVAEYYELLIQQLPADQYRRYADLGDGFAHAYIAASRDNHTEALAGFEQCAGTLPQDIYWYEKGKVLHRLGNDREAEQHLREAVRLNTSNSLAWFNLALVLCESGNLNEAQNTIDTMVAGNIFPEQALLLRVDIFEATGNHEDAVNLCVELLPTPYAHAAAEKLYGILQKMGRMNDAAVIFKKYLNKSCH